MTASAQHSKRDAMALAHAKGSSDIANKQKVNHTGDNGHMQSIAHGTNRKFGQLIKKQHNQHHPHQQHLTANAKAASYPQYDSKKSLPSRTSNSV